LSIPVALLLAVGLHSAWAQRIKWETNIDPVEQRPADSFTTLAHPPNPAQAKVHLLQLTVIPNHLDATIRSYTFKPPTKPDEHERYIVPDNGFRVFAAASFSKAKTYSAPLVKLRNARYLWRKVPNGPWQPVALPTGYGPVMESFDFQSMRQLACYIEPNLPHTGEWKASGQLEIWTCNSDTGEWWRGTTKFNQHWYVRRLPPEKGPIWYSRVEPSLKPLIAKLQYREEETDPWRDIPMPGQPGYPLRLSTGSLPQFRAVKRFPKEPWCIADSGDSHDYYPLWEVKSKNGDLSGTRYSSRGDSPYQTTFWAPDERQPYPVKLTAWAGNRVSVAVILNGDKVVVQEPAYIVNGKPPSSGWCTWNTELVSNRN
jgi:hypothetical protein